MSDGLRILPVDDSPLVREIVAQLLQGLGHEVAIVDGAATALAALDTTMTVDLVLTDYHMPGMDGLALAEEIRERRPGGYVRHAARDGKPVGSVCRRTRAAGKRSARC